MALIDLSGHIFGRLTVVSRSQNGPRGQARWNCLCSCGSYKVVSSKLLRSGETSSCGCKQREFAASGLAHFRHGKRHSAEYTVWAGMIQRCTNPNSPSYPRYGGRGITVCDRWRDSANFLADMGPRPEGTSLERIDNSGGYSPNNCKWATDEEQRANKQPQAPHHLKVRTHCRRGHEFIPENTMHQGSGRKCLTCHKSYIKSYLSTYVRKSRRKN